MRLTSCSLSSARSKTSSMLLTKWNCKPSMYSFLMSIKSRSLSHDKMTSVTSLRLAVSIFACHGELVLDTLNQSFKLAVAWHWSIIAKRSDSATQIWLCDSYLLQTETALLCRNTGVFLSWMCPMVSVRKKRKSPDSTPVEIALKLLRKVLFCGVMLWF